MNLCGVYYKCVKRYTFIYQITTPYIKISTHKYKSIGHACTSSKNTHGKYALHMTRSKNTLVDFTISSYKKNLPLE